ncbi:MAG: four helix bundle suffix domain-containing protein [Candidatus Brocadiia bacterium]
MSGQGESLIPEHGGFRNLKSFRIARLIYDTTVRFCNLYIDERSRTHDQMVQAARSGVQNIAEGSKASGTSAKIELKLTNIARASLEELRCDYEDYLRQRNLPCWEPHHPALERFKERRVSSLEEMQDWVRDEHDKMHGKAHGPARTDTDDGGGTACQGAASSTGRPVRESPCGSVPYSAIAANGALSLLNLCCYFLQRQLAAQARAFKENGGFTERMYRIRKKERDEE